ncbi:beta-propeller fold lactonase family protein, partial [candidate division KSB1 bacterium]
PAFSQANTSSLLKFVEVETGSETGGITGMYQPFNISGSPDGLHLYVTGRGTHDVTAFEIDQSSGDLTLIAQYQNTDGSIPGLTYPRPIAVSPDGNNIYVGGTTEDAIVVFSRNSTTGELTYVQTVYNSEANNAIDYPNKITVSPDNKHVYVAGYYSDGVAVFTRNTSTGVLTYASDVNQSPQWWQQSPPVNVDYYGNHFIDANTGWSVGEVGTIISTADGGDNWSQLSSGVSENLWDVYFVNSTSGWVVGEAGTILKTTDGGANWTTQTSGTGDYLFAVQFIDASIGYITVGNGAVLKTTDGGTNWTSQNTGLSDALLSISFLDANSGWGCGEAGIILKTTDGGSNWAAQTSGVTDYLHSVHFISSTVGWAVGDNGVVLKTTDGGTNWTAQTAPNGNYYGVYFLSTTTGYAVGYNDNLNKSIIIYTSDGGTTWTLQSHVNSPTLRDIIMIDSNNGYIATSGGRQLRTASGGIGGVFGLDGTYDIQVSNDGSYVYAAAYTGDSFFVFSRNSTSGALTLVESFTEQLTGNYGIDGASYFTLSPNEDHVYVSGSVSGQVAAFSRNAGTGKLTFINSYSGTGTAGARGVQVTSDGNFLYVIGRDDDAIVAFSRNSSSGALSYLQTLQNKQGDVLGHDQPWNLYISSDSKYIYSNAYLDDTVIKFTRNTSSGLLTYDKAYKRFTYGLNGIYKLVFSPDGRDVYVAAYTDDNISYFTRNSGTGELTYVESYQNIVNGWTGLDGPIDVTMSPDGKNVYASGNTAQENALIAFTRNEQSGKLTYLETYFNNENGITGMSRPHTSNISPNGKFLYLSGWGGNSLMVFERSLTTGRLTFVEEHFDGENGIDGLRTPGSNLISSDGKFLYQAGISGDAIIVFSIDEDTGMLTHLQNLNDNTDGVDGLDAVTDLTFDPDEEFVYGGSQTDDAIAMFTRDKTTGLLTFVKAYFDNQDGIDGLDGARGIKVSPDGGILIVGGRVDDALTVFSRDRETGELTFVEMYKDEVDGITHMDQVRDVELSPDNKHVYVVSEYDDAVTVFSVNFLFSEIGNKTGKEGDPIEFTVTSPLSELRTLTFWADLSGLPDGAVASFNVNTGKFVWNPSFLHAGTYTVVFYVSDGVLTLAETLTITVADRNLANEKTFNDTTVSVNSSTGGTVQISSGGVYTLHSVTIPPGAIQGSKSIIVQQPQPEDLPMEQLLNVPSAVDFVVQGSESGYTFRDSVELTMEFQNFEVKNKKENMRVHIWDIAKQIWKRVRGNHIINQNDNTVKIKINHFSIYGVIEVNDTTTVSTLQPGWSMISLPVSPGDVVDPVGLFSDDIAPFRNELNNSNIYEYDEELGEWVIPTELSNGNGYILYAFDPSNVDVTGLQETGDITHTLTYTNSNGWHLIGNPFPVDIDWDSDVTLGSNVDDVYYRWNGSEYDFYMGDGLGGGNLTSTIAPWEGVWVHTNQADEEVVISYPGLSKGGSDEFLDYDWRMKISASTGKNTDTYNYIGMAEWADPRYDRADVFELVPLNDEFISLAFPHNNWENNPGMYTQDIRTTGEGSVWEFVVTTNTSHGQVDLNWDLPDIDNPELGFTLEDVQTGERINMHDNRTFTFSVIPHASKSSPGPVLFADDPTDFASKLAEQEFEQRTFRIILGKQTRGHDGTIPDDYVLKQNFPNPFNPETTIEFGLPESGYVKIAIYNSLGQELRTLINTERPAGYHKIQFDGRDNNGRELTSGMYFYKLISKNTVQTKKLILLR